MPQPAGKRVTSWSLSPTWLVAHHPSSALRIGLIAMTWSRIEADLDQLVAVIVGSARVGVFGNTDMLVRRMMAELPNNRARLEVAQAAIDPVLEPTPLFEEWREISVQWSARSKERNKIIHSQWGFSEQAPSHIIRLQRDGKKELWTEKDFLDSSERIEDFRNKLAIFLGRVSDEVEKGTVRLH